eukprot:TRINITY_DN32736_c0_g3_i3.p2 TRINITY_DN32736_c0_g3~~TRINITY_DN32736_c0_g3_i3.p2  ORF type:complete len:120 (-),score=37.13 TRINITY_DN32736_c0_g3_i3:47-406(-)
MPQSSAAHPPKPSERVAKLRSELAVTQRKVQEVSAEAAAAKTRGRQVQESLQAAQTRRQWLLEEAAKDRSLAEHAVLEEMQSEERMQPGLRHLQAEAASCRDAVANSHIVTLTGADCMY